MLKRLLRRLKQVFLLALEDRNSRELVRPITRLERLAEKSSLVANEDIWLAYDALVAYKEWHDLVSKSSPNETNEEFNERVELLKIARTLRDRAIAKLLPLTPHYQKNVKRAS